MQPELGHGVYGISEASLLAGVNPHTLRAWLFQSKSVLCADYDMHKERFAISFLDLIDVAVVGKLREKGLSLQAIRKIYRSLSEQLDTKHPFSHSDLHTDGNKVFMHTLDELGEEHLEDVITRQKAFPKILLEFLEHIEYSDINQIATRWNIYDDIIIDPERNFGKPILDREGISTSVISSAVKANNGKINLVADIYGIDPNAVKNAVKFEDSIKRRPAA